MLRYFQNGRAWGLIPHRSHCDNVVVGDNSASIFRPPGSNRNRLTLALASFFNLVAHVVFLSASEKMLRINARAIVTMMKNVVAVWYLSLVKFVGEVIRCSRNATNHEVAVSVLSLGAEPQPAFSKLRSVCRNWPVLIYFFPESRFWILIASTHKQKTPAAFDVNPASDGGIKNNECESLLSLIFKPIQGRNQFAVCP
jgi:hypothetical protein